MKRVIVVEDDAVAGFIYQTSLKKEGFGVELAADGEVGLKMIVESCPDAVLLDLMMPKISGIEVLKRLRAEPSLTGIPVMVMTNAFVPALVIEAVQAGATKVFNKAETTPKIILDALRNAGCFPTKE